MVKGQRVKGVNVDNKQKMITGEMYNPLDEILVQDRSRAKTLCYKYNQLPPQVSEETTDVIKKLFGKTGKLFTIEPNFFCDYGYNIEIGENFYSNHNLVILDPAPVKFGNNVFIGPNCGFYTPEHPINAKERVTGKEFAKSITIGNNVWIGGNVTVLGGVCIGNNVVIGAGSVVVKNIPDNTVAVGNPCHVIKYI